MNVTPEAGIIVAPAGHGKTHRISAIINGGLSCLALTHTNVAAANMKRRSDASSITRIETIDSLARRLALSFRSVSGVDEKSLDWGRIRSGALAVLRRPAIRDAFKLSYEQVLVDEYQDCSVGQVEFLKEISEIVPLLAFGDPLQSLYDSLDKDVRVTWDQKIEGWRQLPPLNVPWRWQSSPEYSAWIVRARQDILSSRPVSLPGGFAQLVKLPDDRGAYLSDVLRERSGTWAIIVGNSRRPDLLGAIAKRHRWNFLEVAEASHSKELDQFARHWDDGMAALAILTLAKLCISNYSKVSGFSACLKNAESNKATRSSGHLAKLINALVVEPSPGLAQEALALIISQDETATYRPDLLERGQRSLRLAEMSELAMVESVKLVQGEQRAATSQRRAGPLVGNVLRLKGLEFDHVIIVDPESFSSPEEVYVAISRARSSCTIVSVSDPELKWFAEKSFEHSRLW